MPPKVQKSKAQKLLAAQSSAKSGKGKKKWAKSKLRDKKNNRPTWNKALYDQAATETARRRAITIYSIIANYKVSGSAARRLINDLLAQKSIRVVSKAGSMSVYTTTAEQKAE